MAVSDYSQVSTKVKDSTEHALILGTEPTVCINTQAEHSAGLLTQGDIFHQDNWIPAQMRFNERENSMDVGDEECVEI